MSEGPKVIYLNKERENRITVNFCYRDKEGRAIPCKRYKLFATELSSLFEYLEVCQELSKKEPFFQEFSEIKKGRIYVNLVFHMSEFEVFAFLKEKNLLANPKDRDVRTSEKLKAELQIGDLIEVDFENRKRKNN